MAPISLRASPLRSTQPPPNTNHLADQLARVTAAIDPTSGEVLRTVLDVDGGRASAGIVTRIVVTYRVDAHLELLVPDTMTEHYYQPGDVRQSTTAVQINTQATYSNYRRFQTSAEIVR
jgi:hypothetical protein